MDTARSYARTEADLEEVDKLQSYLERNAPYILSLSQRGIHAQSRGAGRAQNEKL